MNLEDLDLSTSQYNAIAASITGKASPEARYRLNLHLAMMDQYIDHINIV